jgi:outer membrane receptor protein involved in Fe transport
VDGVSTPAVTFQGGGAGLSTLKPERSKELELGFDIALLESRLGLEVTYFNKLTDDALINRVLPPSAGGPNARFENLGSTRNYGIEAAITAQIMRSRSFLWEATFAGSLLKNNLRELGPGIPPILLGNQRQVPNYPLGGFWDRDFGFNDANGDGIIGLNEVFVTDTAVYRGPSIPTREFSFRTSATFGAGGQFRVGMQFDYRGGHKLFNNTEAFRCTATGNNCQAIHDPTAPLEDQARAVVRRFHSSLSTMGFIEPADFLKFREVSLSYRLPPSLAGAIGSRGVLLTFAGRNLFTITDYTGLDPEVQSAGQNNFATSDFLTQPQVRTFVLRASLEY